MEIPVLDSRLKTIASLVRPGRAAVDVGADHGYLICYLAATGVIPKGLACDINPMPLSKSQETVRRCGLEGKVGCVLTDGLDGISPEQADEIVIAGMGGDLIADIIERAPWLRSPNKHLILQPMTKPEHLRRYLAREGFSIRLEQAVRSGRFVYTVFSVEYTGDRRELSLLESFAGAVRKGDSPDTAAYLMRVASNLTQRAEGLSQSAGKEYQVQEYREVVAQLEEWIREETK